MIFFDVTKTAPARHSSGLTRVTRRLLDELRAVATGDVTAVVWEKQRWRTAEKKRDVVITPSDWLFTAELFSESERPGIRAFIAHHPCKLGAIFHDAIPLKYPETTWPQSVIRSPEYMKLLADFDIVFPISDHSASELSGFWKWQEVTPRAVLERITLGANVSGARKTSFTTQPAKRLVCVGIIEPRKNQAFLLDACAALWDEGLAFELHLVGRVNPHFGGPVKDKIKRFRKTYRGLHLHEGAPDAELLELYSTSRAAVFPTVAEGCGLPPLEALWFGVPCVCSDLPVLREYTGEGGCVTATVNDLEAWKTALRQVLTDDAAFARLRAEAVKRSLPTWAEAAAKLRATLK